MAYRPLTDHRFKINNGGWINCSSVNTVDNGNGSYTINVGNIAIPIGGLSVQVRPLGINPASPSLTNSVAFTNGGSITFKFPNTRFVVNTMSIDQENQLLSYTSDSDGLVSFTSSNPSVASIVQSGGNYYLHPVSTGTVSVILTQEPNGDFDGITLSYQGTIVVATTITDTTFNNITDGLTATSEGVNFNIPDQNNLILRKYQVVGGKAVYQSSIPNTTLKTAKAVKEIIYNESLGIMPGEPVVDADSIFAAYNPNTLRNIGNSDPIPYTLLKYRFRPFTIIGENSSVYCNKISDTEQRADFPSETGQAFSAFLMLTGGKKIIPPGTWSMSVELKTAVGVGTKTFYYGRNLDSPTGSTYNEIEVTEEYTLFTFPVITFTDFTQENYPWIICSSRTGTHESATLFLRNWRFTAGEVDNGVIPQNDNLILSKAEESFHKGFTQNLDFDILSVAEDGNDNTGLTNSLSHVESTNFNLNPCSMMWAIKIKAENDSGQYNILAYNVASEDDLILIDGEGFFGNTNPWWFSALFLNEKAFNYRQNIWYILTMTTDGNVSSLYINGELINRKIYTVPNLSLKRLDFMGGFDSFAGFARISGITFWKHCLAEEDVIQANFVMSERMRLKNHHLIETHNFYIAEGDSITHLKNSYQKLLRRDYTPNIQGATTAKDGAKLGTSSDVNNPTTEGNDNTVWTRKPIVEKIITQALADGKNVIVSILIGANDIDTLLSSQNVIDYYNNLMSYISSIRLLGAKVIASTVMDCPPFYANNPDGRQRLEQLNALIASDTSKYDGLADYFSNPAFNTASSTYLYDMVHPNSTGYNLMKDIIKPVFESLI